MARRFVAASSQYLVNSAPPLTAIPCTLAAFYRPTQNTNRAWILGVYNSGGGNFFALVATASGGNVQAYQFDNTNTGQDNAGAVTLNVWNHCAAVFTNGSSEAAYLNGVTTGPTAQTAVTPSGIDTTRIAMNLGSEFLDGDVAEAAIWNVALTQAEITMLSAGVSPMLVRPSALVGYWPLRGQDPEPNFFGATSALTLTNAPTVAPHARVFIPDSGRRRWRPTGSNPTITAILAQLSTATTAVGDATTLAAGLAASTTKDAILAQLATATTAISTASALVSALGPNPTALEIAAIQAQITIAINAINNAFALLSLLGAITGVSPQFLYEAFLDGVWADLTPDVLDDLVEFNYGITGDGPMDSIASSGECHFSLRNDAHDGKPLGYYSPNNPNVRTGWMFSVPFRVRVLYNEFFYSRFYGKISSILPDTGPKGRRQVSVIAYDFMRSLAEVDVQEVPIQVNKSESEVITAVLASVPATEQPPTLDLDAGADTYIYALDNLGTSSKAMQVLADVSHSSFYLVAQKGNGTLIGRSRHTRTTVESSFTFDGDFLDLEVPSDETSVYNLVKLTSHPKNIDPSPTTVLYSMTGEVPVVSPFSTVTFWGTFNDPNNAQRLIGGLDAVTTLVPYPSSDYDYAGNTMQDGSGTDATGSLSVVATAFATTVKFDVTNNSSVPVYLVIPAGTSPMLRIRGKGVYDRGQQQFQAGVTQTYGTKIFTADLPFQGDANVAQAACEYIRAAYNSLSGRASKLTFVPKETPQKLFFALTVEPGDRITITEPMTGLTAVDSIVQNLSMSIIEGRHITMSLGLAPANAQRVWLWGVVGKSEWGLTTFYGF